MALATDFSEGKRLNLKLIASRYRGLQLDGLRLLSGVAGKRFTSGIYTKLLSAASPQLVLGKHSENRFAHNLFGTALQHCPDGNFFQPARVTAVVTVNLLVNLIAREPHAFRVDHHHMIAAIEMRSVARLVLTDQQPGNTSSQAPQDLPLGIHDEPIFPHHQRFGLGGFFTQAIAHLGGATLDNEENYLIKKLFTGGLGMVCISNQARI